MLELASLGAGVMHSRSIEFAKKYRVHLRVRPSYSDGPGTLIAPEAHESTTIVTGVAFVRNEALIGLVGLPDQPGVMSSLFTALSSAKIPVDMVVQNVAREGYANVSFTIAEDELPAALKGVEATAQSLGAQQVTTATGLSKVSVVGHGMQTHTGVAARMFQVLAKHQINIKVVTTSEIKISVLIDRARCNDAVLAVHQGFELDRPDAALPQVGYAATGRRQTVNDATNAEVADDIASRLEGMESIVVSDVSGEVDQSRVTLNNLPDDPGIAEDVFTAIAEGGVLVDMIVQNVARSGRATISFTVPSSDLDRSVLLLREVLERYDGSALSFDRSIGKLTITGIGLRSHTDVGRRVFRTLSDSRINVQMINTSEIKLSIVIAVSECDRALELLRAEFGLSDQIDSPLKIS
jgi:aspartate kinase